MLDNTETVLCVQLAAFTFDPAGPTLEQSHVGTGHLLERVVVRAQGGPQEVVRRGRPPAPVGARP